MRWLAGIATVIGAISCASAVVDDPAKDATPYMVSFPLFRSSNMANPDKLPSGVEFHSFRIPSVVKTTTGRILAFSEGRRWSNLDYGDINLVYKRTKTTSDNGATIEDWESLREVVGAGQGTWGNPTPVVDGDTIYLFLSWNAADYSQNGGKLIDGTSTKKIDNTWEGRRHLYLTNSTDDGNTWSTPEDVTHSLTPDSWAWDAVGPGIGIKTTTGELIVPAQRRNIIGQGTTGNRTWSIQELSDGGSEATICQTPDGNLYRNDRPGKAGYRSVARGSLGGFEQFASDTGLPDPACEGSVLLYNLASSAGPARVIFLNSASEDSRRNMRVRISYDQDAKKFDYGRKLSDAAMSGVGYEGGYSSMTKTSDAKIGALVETDFYNAKGGADSHRAILWRRFNLSWILNGPNN